MPTYNYECQACGNAFEKFQSMSARLLRKCPACGATKLERLIGPGAGFIFKGGGFYSTDYRSPSYKSGADAEKSSSGSRDGESGGGSSDGSSDKSAGKPPDKSAGKPPGKSGKSSDSSSTSSGDPPAGAAGRGSSSAEKRPKSGS